MANFKPLKEYLIFLIDQLVEKHALSDPFLDIGCGTGEISLHFAQKGWKGKAIDVSEKAAQITKITLRKHQDAILIKHKDLADVKGKYQTVFLCDVLEHIANDEDFLENVKKVMARDKNGGHLILSVPIYRNEWRWDDRFYGHIRRYEVDELVALLNKKGFLIKDIWDFTFPVFWLLRRIYTTFLPEKLTLDQSKETLSANSSLQSSWDRGILTTIVEKAIWWRPVFYLQSKFKEHLFGCECVLVAKLVD